ncbi:hypothetical protein [Microbacterium sp. gxy059]|uniref:hypothetical protein n=1 Tax=Microbacterium sp. gxy059 TaxID=2957199 RepID=UPI003D969D5B
MRTDYCQFALLCEGTSDAPLVTALETLLVEAGFDEVYGEAHTKRGSVEDALAEMAENRDSFHIVFVHRDADRAGREARTSEIARAAANIAWAEGDEPRIVPVIPVTMTEAWLLLNEAEIRAVCGNPRGSEALDLPKPHEIEGIADPKAVLFDVLRQAAPQGGRRRLTVQALSAWRSHLVERLDVHGRVRSLGAWQALEDEIAAVWDEHRGVRRP